ncbi:hypothetical protein B5M09_006798 [Aphanomyces astaci]|uniref:fructokinase n=1 Tax=Aphanomyces astaci TaxID=112090 RepID=A0A425CX66_APHAT|nr:hypothetical protein B5M09_006798 [Aphanomyces astaci]
MKLFGNCHKIFDLTMPFVAWTPATWAMFVPTKATTPTLGVNYLQASQKQIEIAVDSSNNARLTISQDMSLGVGGVLWNCGRAIVQALSRHPELVRGHDVLEMGCGTGAASLAAGYYGPRSLLLTDLCVVLPLTHINAQRALQDHPDVFSAMDVAVREFKCPKHPFGLVLCSDCLYEPSVFGDFVQSLIDVTATGSRVLLAYKQRIPEREEQVFLGLSKLFTVQLYSADAITGLNFDNDNVFVELGGTTWALAIAHDNPLNIVARTRIDTTTPDETIAKAFAWLDTQNFDALGVFHIPIFETHTESLAHMPSYIGIASFGPVDLNPASPTYGYITTTPKPHWANTSSCCLPKYTGVPINFETDVNAPALFEAAFGGHGPDVSSVCYITVGTGIGVGVCIDGKPVHGRMHPEAGHMFVPLAPADIAANFQGLCPFHSSCAEGMAAAGAIAARTRVDRTGLHEIPDTDPVWDIVAHYLALVCVNLTLTVSPHVIVLGGGVSKRQGLLGKIHTKVSKPLCPFIYSTPNKLAGL